LDRYLIAAMAPYAWAWRLLQTIPGIDEIAAAMILIEIGADPQRFGSAARLASWAALCPGNNDLDLSRRRKPQGRTGNGAEHSLSRLSPGKAPFGKPASQPY
jgi:transposase